MARMTNQQLIEKFAMGNAEHGDQSHTGNLWVTPNEDKLMNYGTCLVHRVKGHFIFNETKYSSTTSKIQSYIRRELGEFISLVNVPIETKDLYDWYMKSEGVTN